MNNMWKKIFIYLISYLTVVGFALIGGIIWYKKDEDEEIIKTFKTALIVTLLFAGISALLSIYNYIGGMTTGYYSSNAYELYSILSSLVNIAKIITYTVLILKVVIDYSNNKNLSYKTSDNNYNVSENKKNNTKSNENKKITKNDEEINN